MKHRNAFARILAPLVLLAVLSACGSDNNNVIAPQFEPEVVNLQDSFSFQATGTTNVTQTLVYHWENTGPSANVDQSCSISDGSATVTVLDAQGTTVYTRNLTDDGSFPTADGLSGTWTIRVTLSNASGTLNLSLQKRTP